jgi:hypothetical protein
LKWNKITRIEKTLPTSHSIFYVTRKWSLDDKDNTVEIAFYDFSAGTFRKVVDEKNSYDTTSEAFGNVVAWANKPREFKTPSPYTDTRYK